MPVLKLATVLAGDEGRERSRMCRDEPEATSMSITLRMRMRPLEAFARKC
jgi:hypothetical protein